MGAENVVQIQPEQKAAKGLTMKRFFTQKGASPYDTLEWKKRTSVISEPNGKVVFESSDVETPAFWSQLATDIVVSKYFRKAGVQGTGGEVSVRQVVKRIVNAIRVYGEKYGYFHSEEDAQTFADELAYMLLHQRAAFNSPVWFNCGLHHAYGISGSPGNFRHDDTLNQTVELENSYAYPQCSACFIQSLDDDLMSIFSLLRKEARVFKFGSGSGTNFSNLRSKHERLSGGGTSSGVMSFLEVFDKGAGATKSGGTTRRAAKMVCLDMDHPEVLDFIRWKAKEETKAKILIAGGMAADFNGEVYQTISGQNANNSVRMNDAFMKAYEQDGEWRTIMRTTGEVHKTYKAKEMMQEVAQAAWACADPGVQYDTTINAWHTCPNTQRINASNPCSEFMFLDDTACNLASINLLRYWDEDSKVFDLEGYKHSTRVLITAMEILVGFSSYPTEVIAKNSHDYRPLGLGYANLGSLLMVNGLPYDSDEGRAWAAALTSVMCGEAYAVSAELAQQMGTFAGYEKNREPMLRVIGKHRQAAKRIERMHCPSDFYDAAQEAWARAEGLGNVHGYRNAQATVLAPTGTIGLLMDCDTTGVEPDFSLIKWKKLAGGGYVKIVNQSLPLALRTLGYGTQHIEDITRYILGARSLTAIGLPLSQQDMADLGYSKEEIAQAEAFVQQAGSWTRFTPHVHAAALRERGVAERTILTMNWQVNGHETIEGAPHLKEEHLPVFDCANKCGKKGTRSITPMAHVQMMAAVQPFISGAISKTINMPEETCVEEIERLYVQAWRAGVKAVAVYRDNSKGSQPLSASLESSTKDKSTTVKPTPLAANEAVMSPAAREKEREIAWHSRRELSRLRHGTTLEAIVGGHKLFLRTGEYDNKELGEIFIDMYKEGAAYRSMMNSFAQAVSVGLQYGVPLEKFVKMFTFTRFDPCGMTDHPNVRTATSILDFIFRVLGMQYLDRYDFVHVPPQVTLAKEGTPAIPASTKGTDTRNDLGQTVNAANKESAFYGVATAASPNEHLAEMMGDAPVCDSCGHLTVRNGSCYRCLNCGNSMGCS